MTQRPTRDEILRVSAWLQEKHEEQLWSTGRCVCPTCFHDNQIHRRQLTGVGLQVLVGMRLDDLHNPDAWIHIGKRLSSYGVKSRSAHQGGYTTLAHHWKLIESSNEYREDGVSKGLWRPTDRGREYVDGTRRIWKTLIIYRNEVVDWEAPKVSINDCWGEPFDLRDVYYRPPPPPDDEEDPPM